MPLYELECPSCGHMDEYFQGMNDEGVEVPCDGCGDPITRKNRVYGRRDCPYLKGLPTGGGGSLAYDFYDPTMEEQVSSPQNQKDLMKKHGLERHNPHPDDKNHRDNIRYMINNAEKDDPSLGKAIAKESGEAHRKRKKRLISKAYDKYVPNV